MIKLQRLSVQGGGEAPKNLSGRLLAATWWLFGFIIIASYTANLAAFLTLNRQDNIVGSLDDLGKQFKIQYSAVKGSSNAKYFERRAYIENRFYEYDFIQLIMILNSNNMQNLERNGSQ